MKGQKEQIYLETFIEAPVEEVWKAITDCEMVSQWLMETNIEPRVGFKGYFKMKAMPGFDGNILAEVLEVQENRKFTFTWQGGWMKQPTTVRFTLKPELKGTQLILEHCGFEGILGSLLKVMMTNGWRKMINKKIPVLLKAKI